MMTVLRNRLKLIAVGTLALCLGLALATWAAWRQQQANETLTEQRFKAKSENLVDELLSRVQSYEYGLRGARGVVVAAGERSLERKTFLTYMQSREIDREFPGARGFGVIYRVAQKDEAAFVAASRRDGWPEFKIRQLTPHDNDRYVIRYIEPVERNQQAVGLDIASEQHRKEAAESAAHDNQPRLTAPITLVQATGATLRSFLFLLPVYHTPVAGLSESDRARACTMWVYAPLVIDEILRGVTAADGEVALTLHDEADAEQPFYTSAASNLMIASPVQVVIRRQVYGRTWLFTMQPLPAFYTHLNLRSPLSVFAIWATSAALLIAVGYVYWFIQLQRYQLLQFNRDLEREVLERTAQLKRVTQENQGLLNTLNNHAIVSITDRDGKILEVNDAFCAISGYAREELLGKNNNIVNSGTHPKSFWTEMWQRIGSGHDWRGEICNRAKDGNLYWVDSVIAPFFGEDGRIKRYISIRTDVTARKLAARDLDIERERLDGILRGTGVGTWEMNVLTGELLLNERWAEIIGYKLSELGELTIRSCTRYAHPDDLASTRETLRAHLRGDTDQYHVETRSLHRDGTWRWVADIGRVTKRTADGRVEWLAGIRQDIHARRQMEESLRDATKKAEAASAAKSQFLANMSHEIRTPLNAVIGLSHLLEDTPLNGAQRDSVGKIQIAGRSLLGVINNVLDLSKIEAGEMDLERAPFDLYGLLSDVEQLVVDQTQKKGLKLVVTKEPAGVPRMLVGDVTRMRQIFVNLLGNAIKFTERGQIELRVELLEQLAEGVRLRCAVRDTGIGIPPDTIAKLFTAFSQADSSTTRRFGGTGLGLSIVRQLAELMGGKIGVNSAVGVGSEFWVEIPFPIAVNAQASGELNEHINASLNDLRALVVDDSEVNLEVARKILEREGMHVTVRGDGQQAVETLRASPDAFDIVLMDVQMPVMDGNTAARIIRNDLKLTELPIVALTAGALVTERQKTVEAGMNDFATKPLNPKSLVDAVRRNVGRAKKPVATRVIAENSSDNTSAVHAAGKWPAIASIDMKGVVELLGDDMDLFTTMLTNFIAEYSDLTTLSLPNVSDSGQRSALTARMHKLKGSAGTLQAAELARLAGEAERLLKNEGAELNIADVMEKIGVALRTLQNEARHIQVPGPADVTAAQGQLVDAAALETLLSLLRKQNLQAQEYFKSLSSGLAGEYTADEMRALKNAIEELRFARAIEILTRHRLSA